jgi:hypothetical protein
MEIKKYRRTLRKIGFKGMVLNFFALDRIADTVFKEKTWCMGPVPLTSALLNLPKGKSLGRSKPATNS